MRKLYPVLWFLFIGFIFIACNKDDVDVYDRQAALEREAPVLSSYITDQGLSDSAVLHQESGIWYVLENPGEGDFNYLDSTSSDKAQLVNARVLVKYSGRLLNGTLVEGKSTIDSADLNNQFLQLGNEIRAWGFAFYPQKINQYEIGGILPNGLQKGAKIRIITPSVWAYENKVSGEIPANSPLDFEIEVIDIKTPPTTNQ